MATDTPAGRERAALCERFAELGPDAPTLCEGWRADELAAHLYMRERRPHAALGLVVPPLNGLTERTTERMKAIPFEKRVERLRRGPPLPLVPVDNVINLHEFFVHHEDVRRVGDEWTRREDEALDSALWKLLSRSARFLARRVKGVGLALEWPGTGTIRARPGDPVATVKGGPQEIVLYLFGRRAVSDVALEGPPEAVEALERTDLSA